MMKGGTGEGFASSSSTWPKGFAKRMTTCLSELASIAATCAIIVRPAPSFAAQRLSDATQSSAVTGLPSCHFSPSRRVKV